MRNHDGSSSEGDQFFDFTFTDEGFEADVKELLVWAQDSFGPVAEDIWVYAARNGFAYYFNAFFGTGTQTFDVCALEQSESDNLREMARAFLGVGSELVRVLHEGRALNDLITPTLITMHHAVSTDTTVLRVIDDEDFLVRDSGDAIHEKFRSWREEIGTAYTLLNNL